MVLFSSLAAISQYLAVAPAACDKKFFGLVPWFHYLNDLKADCSIDSKQFQLLGAQSDLVLIFMAIVDDLLRIAGFVAVAFVIIGGYKYITSQGSPESAATARKTLINALVGLAISIMAVAIVSFIARSLGA